MIGGGGVELPVGIFVFWVLNTVSRKSAKLPKTETPTVKTKINRKMLIKNNQKILFMVSFSSFFSSFWSLLTLFTQLSFVFLFLVDQCFFGAGGENRTHDLLFTKQLLCH